MKFYAVIDTNVLVSALLKRNSAPWQILSESINGTIVPLYNGEILSEYTEVLLRKKFNFPENLVLDLLRELSKCGILINAERTQEQLPDPDDAVFYEVVMSAREKDEAYLVTGNLKHFPVKPFIVTPREMLEIIQNSKS